MLLVGLSMILSACQAPQPEAPTPAAPTPAKSAPDIRKIVALFEAAEAALRADHLTYPEAGSAYVLFQEILALDPGHEAAQRGLERIVERYVELAMSALERRQFASARSYLSRARIIDPGHPSIEPSAEQIRLIMSAQRDVLRIDRIALAVKDAQLQAQLRDFAGAAKPGCRFTISARNDGEGRWIYQTMSAAVTDTRLRAQVRIQAPPQVERLCFAR